jgi:hypothetical protein
MSPRGAMGTGAKALTAATVVRRLRCAGKTGNRTATCENDYTQPFPGSVDVL